MALTQLVLDAEHSLPISKILHHASRFAGRFGPEIAVDADTDNGNDPARCDLRAVLLEHWAEATELAGCCQAQGANPADTVASWTGVHVSLILPLVLWLDLSIGVVARYFSPAIRCYLETKPVPIDSDLSVWRLPLDPIVNAHMARLDLDEHCVMALYHGVCADDDDDDGDVLFV